MERRKLLKLLAGLPLLGLLPRVAKSASQEWTHIETNKHFPKRPRQWMMLCCYMDDDNVIHAASVGRQTYRELLTTAPYGTETYTEIERYSNIMGDRMYRNMFRKELKEWADKVDGL